MLDSFEILTTSGVVLWSKTYSPVSHSIINGFIKEVFIEEKAGAAAARGQDGPVSSNPAFKKEKYTLKWTSVKELGLIFVVMFAQSSLEYGLTQVPGRLPITTAPYVDRQIAGEHQGHLRRPVPRSAAETTYQCSGVRFRWLLRTANSRVGGIYRAASSKRTRFQSRRSDGTIGRRNRSNIREHA